ncbi:MAG: GntR family transcriptional regulator [Thermomicrobiales bacterium]
MTATDRRLNDHTWRTPLKRDQAYAVIRRAIIHLDLQPGSLIDESALSQCLGLGRTPIREALQRLMHEGLVSVFPRRGMMVAPIDALESKHLTQARLVCEPNIARLAACTGTVNAWDDLERVLAEAPVAHETVDDVAKALEVNAAFHLGIAEATGNPFLVELVQRYLHQRARLSFLFFRHSVYDPITAQHYEILACLRAGNGDAAARLMEQHIQVTRDRDARVLP